MERSNVPRMKVALTVNDFLRRAELLYPDREAIADEPDQPAESWGSITYGEMARRARAMAAGLDALGIGVGERVAMVSHNSARLLTALFGVSGSGRILVPINYTRKGRFRTEPAVPVAKLPDLAAATKLADATPHEQNVIKTHLVRGMNRVGAAFEDATDVIRRAVEKIDG